MNTENNEKRKFQRHDFPCKIFLRFPQGEVLSTYTRNISQQGVKVLLDKKLDISTIVDIEIYFEQEPTICKGKVVWVKEKENPSRKDSIIYATGIKCFE